MWPNCCDRYVVRSQTHVSVMCLNATWHDADVEIHKIARCARGSHALFHVKQLHGFDLVFRGSGELARLVVPAICR